MASSPVVQDLLFGAARGGSSDVFHTVLNVLGDRVRIIDAKMSELLQAKRCPDVFLVRCCFVKAVGHFIFCVVYTIDHTGPSRALLHAYAFFPPSQNVAALQACDVVEARSFSGYTILMAAARGGSVDIVSLVQKQLAGYQDKSKVTRGFKLRRINLNLSGTKAWLSAFQSCCVSMALASVLPKMLPKYVSTIARESSSQYGSVANQ